MRSLFKKMVDYVKAYRPNINFRFSYRPLFQRKTLAFYTIWKKFLRQIPTTFRPVLRAHKNSFIVMGEEGSGKTFLIRRFTDKDRDIYPFETTYTQSSEVQFYLSSTYVAQELSWSVVEDRSLDMRKRLARLWQRMYRVQEPIAVIAFNPLRWEHADQTAVQQYARTLYHKLALLSHTVKAPVRVRLALTQLDQLPGFSTLLSILGQHGLSLETTIAASGLKDPLAGYASYLPLILRETSAEGYLEVLDFLKRWPALFRPIEELVRTLAHHSWDKKVLVTESLYFIAPQETWQKTQPFSCPATMPAQQLIRRHLIKHQLACTALLAASVCYMAGKYTYEHQRLQTAQREVVTLERYQSLEAAEKTLSSLSYLPHQHFSDWTLAGLPAFFYHPYQDLSHHFVTYSQDYILAPALRRSLLDSQAEVKTLYLLALLHATQHNQLGELIQENLAEWSQTVHLPESFIDFYLSLCQEPLSSHSHLDTSLSWPAHHPLSDSHPWSHFLDHVVQALDKPKLFEATLTDLQRDAALLQGYLHELHTHHLLPFIGKLLAAETSLELQPIFIKRLALIQELRDNSDGLQSLLKLVLQTSLQPPAQLDTSLLSFVQGLKENLLNIDHTAAPTYHFLLNNKTFHIDAQAWHRLAIHTRAKQTIDSYLLHHRHGDETIFFENACNWLDLPLSYLNADFPVFKAQEQIAGIYTQTAYEQNILPLAEPLNAINTSPLLDGESKNQLNKFIAYQLENYARRYRKEYQTLLTDFALRTDSLTEVKHFIKRMTEPMSAFSYFLQTVSSNLKLLTKEAAWLQPLKTLAEFSFLEPLFITEDSRPAPWFIYQELLHDMLADLEADNQGDSISSLQPYLSRVAQLSLQTMDPQADTHLKKAQAWLLQHAIPVKYHSFFLQPFAKVYTLGLQELTTGICQAWFTECHPNLCAIAGKFPFRSDSTDSATFEDVEAIFHPQSYVWQHISHIIAPISHYKNGRWYPKEAISSLVDDKIYASVNRLQEITGLLWDKDGQPKALEIKVQTVPFAKEDTSTFIPVLAYLIVDHTSIFNINQHPEWQTIKLEWWKPCATHIGVELVNAVTKGKSYPSMKREDSLWSFFQLLQCAENRSESIWEWNLNTEFLANNPKASFRFDNDPWHMLQLETFKVDASGHPCQLHTPTSQALSYLPKTAIQAQANL